ncbi:unnamed protein product [Nyctereutes procyonoides]|uniref:(raccoon dog) hypothetical protein n=1 Tax=Nyctereutes procyonoides TaxID=34880 RepID=A0A811Z5P9_NYCPR|nr:unnamed protein product [Nyctereutes procyonoides]
MSHTPVLVFCLGSRPLFPLGGGNVAALQHEGTVGSVRPGRSFRGEGRCRRAPLGSHRPSSRASGVEGQGRGGRRGGRRGGLDRQRDSLHCSCCAEAARELARGPRREPRRRRLGSSARGAGTGKGAGSGRVGTPGHLAGVPAPRAGIRLGRPVRSERGARPGRLGGLGPQEVGAWTPGLRAVAQHTGRLVSGLPPRGSHLRDGGHGSQRTRRWGREAGPEVGGEAWRPRAGSAAASTTRGRWGRLRLCPTRQETFRPGGENIKTNGRQAPVPARLSPHPLPPAPPPPPPVPVMGHDLGRPLRGRAAGI